MESEKRIGFVGVIIENRQKSAAEVNTVLGCHADIILARIGLPNARQSCAVITLIVDTDTDTLGKLTGQLGQIEGISVKSALAKPSKTER